MADWTAETIKALRIARRESQAAFAEHFGVDQSAVSLWENSSTSPRGPILKILETLPAQPAAEPAERAA